MILVTGATGNTASGLIPALRSKGADVRALVREESKAQPLRDQGVEVMIGNLSNPETLDRPFAGVEKVVLITANGPDQATNGINAIEAAKRAGNPHIVRASGLVPAPAKETVIGRQLAEIEEKLKASGLPYTIIRPTFFMQNTMIAAQSVASQGVIYMPLKDGHIGMVDLRDIVEVDLKVLTSCGHEGKTYTLTGPESISIDDVAAGLSKALGKEIKYVDVPLEAGREAMVGMGVPEFVADGFIEVFKNFSEGGGDLTTHDVEFVTGNPPRSYETFARDFAQVFAGAS